MYITYSSKFLTGFSNASISATRKIPARQRPVSRDYISRQYQTLQPRYRVRRARSVCGYRNYIVLY